MKLRLWITNQSLLVVTPRDVSFFSSTEQGARNLRPRKLYTVQDKFGMDFTLSPIHHRRRQKEGNKIKKDEPIILERNGQDKNVKGITGVKKRKSGIDIEESNLDCHLRSVIEPGGPKVEPNFLKHPDIQSLTKKFDEKMNELNLLYCIQCKEQWFGRSRPCNTYKCDNCTAKGEVFSADNDMDPLVPNGGRDVESFQREYYNIMENYPLNNVEEALIAKNAVIMQAFRLKGGSTGFKGNVVSFPQRVDDICLNLPRLPTEIKYVVVRRYHHSSKDDESLENYDQFKVRRENI